MELGESMEETARREVEEETGLLINDLKLLGLFSGEEYHFTFDNGDEIYSVTAVYQTSTYSGKIVPNKDESLDVRFFADLPPELLPEYRTYIEPYYIPKNRNNRIAVISGKVCFIVISGHSTNQYI